MWKILTLLSVMLLLITSATYADNTKLSLNGAGFSVWFISGEPSLVINGFDLDSLRVTRPVTVESINISVVTPVPGAIVEAVVYQDSDGGSPVNARIVGRQSIDIQTSGVANVTFNPPLTVTDRFMWVGFYLPVGFEFYADRSGSSVLTYWGWTPNSTFDLNNLSSATVFGPANGTAPVNLNMNGIARITASITRTFSDGNNNAPVIGQQIVGDPTTVNFDVMDRYGSCGALRYDRADIAVTYRDNIDIYCKIIAEFLSPTAPTGYNRVGGLFDVYVFGVPSGLDPLPDAVTHCLRPREQDRTRALIGLAYGAPRRWEILPTVRFGDFICAEVKFTGFISYFVPN